MMAGHVEETEGMVALSSAWFWNSHRNLIDCQRKKKSKKIITFEFSLMRVCIEYDDPVVAELIHSSLSRYFSIEITSASEAALQWSSYKSISFETILCAVSDHYRVPVDVIRGQRRDKSAVQARQVAMYLCRELTGSPLSRIGETIGGRDHTTAQRSIAKILGLLESDATLQDQIRRIRSDLDR